MKKTKCNLILDYMNNHDGKITNIEVIRVASTTSPHKFLQYLVHKGLVKSEKAPNKAYHIYSLTNNQLKFL